MVAEFKSGRGKALQNSLNAEAPLKDWSRERLRELENQQPLDSNLILRLKALREMCRNYGIEKLKPQDQFNSSREIFNHFHQQLERQKQEQFIIVLLDNKHRYLAEEDVTKGILNKTWCIQEKFLRRLLNIVPQL